MRTRLLGDQTVATVGLGDVSLGRSSKRGRDPREVTRRVHEAIEAAIDLIDVSSDFETERMVGDAVRALRARDRVIVATRVEPIALARDTFDDKLPIGYVVERVDAALRATKLDALQLAQLPLRAAWRASPVWAELVGTCDRLVREGKVLRWGAISEDPELVAEPWLASIGIAFSACTRAAAAVLVAATTAPVAPSSGHDPLLAAALPHAPLDLLAAIASAHGPAAGASLFTTASSATAPKPVAPRTPIVVLAHRPLAGGALAGTIGPGVRMAPRDDRRGLEPAQLEAIAVGIAKLARHAKHTPPAAGSCAAARAITESSPKPETVTCATVAELALRYVIDRGAIALPRIHRPDDLFELVACGSAPPLSLDLIATIEELWPDPVA